MNKLQALRGVNILLVIAFVVQAITSIVIFFNIKFSFIREIFEIHEYNGLLMIILVVVHFILNWGWVRANIFKRKNAV